MSDLLDSGQQPLWTPTKRAYLDRCPGCEHHPATQGHHNWCPDQEKPG